jgi:type I restriction enzyme S subunit
VGCIHYGQIYTKFGSHTQKVYSYVTEELAARLKKVVTGNLVVTTTSENMEDVCKAVAWLGESEIVIGGHSCVYRHNLDPLFATYLFRSRIFQDQKNSFVQGTKVKDIKTIQIGKIEIFIPPMKEQIAIGKILCDFDALISDMDIGLPAEIKSRRKQYEYYRNKILTFKKLEVV